MIPVYTLSVLRSDGVIVAKYARTPPDRVASLINVEGNFTLADAFWFQQVAEMTPGEFREIWDGDRADPARWLAAAGIEATAERILSAAEPRRVLEAFPDMDCDVAGTQEHE